jgi:hypothetical protein
MWWLIEKIKKIDIKKIDVKKLDIKIIIIFLLLAVVYLQTCSVNKKSKNSSTVKIDGEKYDIVSKKIDTLYLTITKVIKGNDIYHKVIFEKDNTIKIPVLSKVDTNNIIKNYFAKIEYRDTLKIDTLGTITLIDTLSNNRILGRQWTTNIKERTIRETITVKEKPRNNIYGGFNIFFNQQDFNGVNVGLILKSKKETIYQINLGLLNKNGILASNYGIGVYSKF